MIEFEHLKCFFYVDEPSIQELYNQLPENPSTQKITVSNEFGIKAILCLLKGIITPSIEGEIRHNTVDEKFYNISIEEQIEELIKQTTYDQTPRLNHLISKNEKCNQFFIASGMFQLTELYKDCEMLNPEVFKNSQHSISESGKLKDDLTWVLEYGKTANNKRFGYIGDLNIQEYHLKHDYQVADFYSVYTVTMRLAGLHMRKRLRHFTDQIKLGTGFDLTVLGYLHHIVNNNYSIKPYAIWFSDSHKGLREDNLD